MQTVTATSSTGSYGRERPGITSSTGPSGREQSTRSEIVAVNGSKVHSRAVCKSREPCKREAHIDPLTDATMCRSTSPSHGRTAETTGLPVDRCGEVIVRCGTRSGGGDARRALGGYPVRPRPVTPDFSHRPSGPVPCSVRGLHGKEATG